MDDIQVFTMDIDLRSSSRIVSPRFLVKSHDPCSEMSFFQEGVGVEGNGLDACICGFVGKFIDLQHMVGAVHSMCVELESKKQRRVFKSHGGGV